MLPSFIINLIAFSWCFDDENQQKSNKIEQIDSIKEEKSKISTLKFKLFVCIFQVSFKFNKTAKNFN